MAKLKVEMNKSVGATEIPNHKPGDKLELDEKVAVEFVQAEYANPVGWDASDYEVSENGESQSEADESETEEFDFEDFLDRTPMSDVVEDIEAGEADEYLNALVESANRQGVQDAIEERQEEIA